MRKFLLFFTLIICAVSLKAQPLYSNSGHHKDKYHSFNPGTSPFSLGVHVGTQGFGANIAFRQSDKISYRVSVSDAPVGVTRVRNWGSEQYNAHLNATFQNVAAKIEYRPFNALGYSHFTQQLVVVAGAGYFFKAEGHATVTPKNPFQYGDITIKKEDEGYVKADINWKEWAPYLGVGLRELKVSNHLAVNFDLGTYYLQSPTVKLTATKMLAGNISNEQAVQNNFNSYHWLPVLQAGLSYRF